jgi:predicted molibdopterin-dependent oxidoreductase YjgC
VVTITLNGREIEADAGRPLLEVIKEQGIAITNLCYIDGLEPYAGCRTCIVEVEGARPTPLQVACATKVADKMVVRTDTDATKRQRQSVMSMIMANHPDRCLSCHRRVHCMPGDICLRDDVVTHRCLTCSKNYRCELQTSCEMIDMGEFEEPWVGEARSYYEVPPPEPDRANPFLEFDPQMCILCTRCVRACDQLRHTGAIALSGKGHTTMIAFGTGGAIHESSCDFCGACIDVCPTATLMEKPNKWMGRADDWTNSVCNSCAVGCSLSYGQANGEPVIVRPDRAVNPFSRDQICVRGRFGYDAVGTRERLSRHLARAGERLLPVSFEDAIARAAEALDAVRKGDGPGAIAVLGSPLATNEEAYLLRRLARDVIKTPHLDFAHGPTHRAVADALRGAFGTERLPADLTALEQAPTIVVIGGDLEESHQVAALRIKDAVEKRHARLVVISSRWGELEPFTRAGGAWLRTRPGHEAAAAHALAEALGGNGTPTLEGVAADGVARALEALRAGKAGDGAVAVVFAPNAIGAAIAGDEARAAANLAIAANGDAAAEHLHYLPTDANVHGLADMGVAPAEGGKSFPEIIAAAKAGQITALVIHDDNPLLSAPGRADVQAALEAVPTLIVIDSLRSTTAELATVVLAERPFFAKEGTITNADHRILRQRAAGGAQRDEQQGTAILTALANALGDAMTYAAPIDVMREIAERVPNYATHEAIATAPGTTRALPESQRLTANRQPVGAPPPAAEGLTLVIGRSLFTSWEGSSIHSPDADKLHREEALAVHPQDAADAGLRAGDEAALVAGDVELRVAVRLDDGVGPGWAYLPHYYDGGAAMALLPLEGAASPITGIRLRALQPA